MYTLALFLIAICSWTAVLANSCNYTRCNTEFAGTSLPSDGNTPVSVTSEYAEQMCNMYYVQTEAYYGCYYDEWSSCSLPFYQPLLPGKDNYLNGVRYFCDNVHNYDNGCVTGVLSSPAYTTCADTQNAFLSSPNDSASFIQFYCRLGQITAECVEEHVGPACPSSFTIMETYADINTPSVCRSAADAVLASTLGVIMSVLLFSAALQN